MRELSHEPIKQPAVSGVEASAVSRMASGCSNGERCLTGGAEGIERVDLQHDLLAGVEARLTQEVSGLVLALHQFGSRAQAIGEEVPSSAKFCKLVTGFLGLLSLQLAYSLGKDLDKPIFFDDGRQYLADLNLSLNEFIREVDLDGRRFMAVAFVDQHSPKVDGRTEA